MVKPFARQMGFTMLGTLRERIASSRTTESARHDAERRGRSGRFPSFLRIGPTEIDTSPRRWGGMPAGRGGRRGCSALRSCDYHRADRCVYVRHGMPQLLNEDLQYDAVLAHSALAAKQADLFTRISHNSMRGWQQNT
jgi:hypothetical protein